MIQGTETRLEGNTVVVRIPMRFQRRGGRKRIVAPDGSQIVPTSKPPPDGTLVKALTRAWRWQGMLEEGRFASVRELAEAERVSFSYISRILRLTLLAPDVVERILDGRPAPQLAKLMQPFPVGWKGNASGSSRNAGLSDGRRTTEALIRASAPAEMQALQHSLNLLRAHRTIAGPPAQKAVNGRIG